jgi:hypothetical protein
MSGFYHKTVQATFLGTAGSLVDLDADTIRVAMVSSAYTYSDAHQFYSDLTGVIGAAAAYNTNAQLTSVTMDATGAISAANTTITDTSATACAGLVIYKQGASAAASPLIAFISAGTGLPFTPNGNVLITWDTGANKIAKL